MRICMDCKHHNGARGAVWYDHLCACPAVAIPKRIDPVSGRMVPARTAPYCRDINTEGECPDWASLDSKQEAQL